MESFQCCLSKGEMPSLVQDCILAFNCSVVDAAESNYSAGDTFFRHCDDPPRIRLEAYAKSIFDHHTRNMEFDRSESGYEWWTQVIDSRDDIGFHWDRDYGEEERSGRHLYPTFATVTYLSASGGPTVILDKPGTATSLDVQGLESEIRRATLSVPAVGKHIKFDGRLLHAAPCDVIDDRESDDKTIIDDDDSGSESSSGKSSSAGDETNEDDDDQTVVQRVTFLVNIWLNHKPLNSNPFPLPKATRKRGRGKTDTTTSINSSNNSIPSLCSPDQPLPKLTFNIPEPAVTVQFAPSNTHSATSTDSITKFVRRKWVFYEGMSTSKRTYVVEMPLYTNMKEKIESWFGRVGAKNSSDEDKGGGTVVLDYEDATETARLRKPNIATSNHSK